LLSFFWGMPSRQNQWYKRVGILLLCTNCLGCLNKRAGGDCLASDYWLVFCFTSVTQCCGEMRVLLGGLLVLAIALPWYLLVIRANG